MFVLHELIQNYFCCHRKETKDRKGRQSEAHQGNVWLFREEAKVVIVLMIHILSRRKEQCDLCEVFNLPSFAVVFYGLLMLLFGMYPPVDPSTHIPCFI